LVSLPTAIYTGHLLFWRVSGIILLTLAPKGTVASGYFLMIKLPAAPRRGVKEEDLK
jgi:hypothetical protein